MNALISILGNFFSIIKMLIAALLYSGIIILAMVIPIIIIVEVINLFKNGNINRENTEYLKKAVIEMNKKVDNLTKEIEELKNIKKEEK